MAVVRAHRRARPPAGRAGGAVRRMLPLWMALGLTPVTFSADDGPQVDFHYPAGGRVGTSAPVSVAGRFTSWPVQVWTDDPGLRLMASAAPGHFTVEIAPDAALGPHWIRWFDEVGASAPRLFVVDELPEQLAAEEAPDSIEDSEEELIVPGVLNGRMPAGGGPRYWRLNLADPVRLELEAAATRLDSPATLELRLYDQAGGLLAESTNQPPTDPELRCLIGRAGVYRLEIRATGATAEVGPPAGVPVIFRLRSTLAEAPKPTPALPGGPLFESAPLPDQSSRVILREVPEPPGESRLHPETLSPSDAREGMFGGFINPPGDEDRFAFLARREETHRWRLRRVNPEADFWPVLRVLRNGEVLAESLPGLPEAVLEWTAPADDAYTLCVADARAGG